MNNRKNGIIIVVAGLFSTLSLTAETTEMPEVDATTSATKSVHREPVKKRLQLGGYGEATVCRNFYSNNYKRYTDASLHKNDDGYCEFDLPHVVFFVGYDFGKGWTLGTEIEFEHGGTEAAVEIEEEETGEYESEIERGGEVALEQFWIQKSWSKAVNLRMGHIIVPVGATNQHHQPNEFFSVFRPEGERTILPCTWHETGVSLWGRTSDWRYEMQFLAGLEADLFSSSGWVNGGSASPYEFKLGTNYAAAVRIDNYSIPGFRLGVSGYCGNSAQNSMKATKYADVKGTVLIGAFDFDYKGHNWLIRGNYDYGHLSDSEQITKINKTLGKGSVSPETSVASAAMALGVEAGYDLLSQISKARLAGQRLYLFGRYDNYDSMYKTQGSVIDNPCWERQKVTLGLNYYPIKQVVVKAEYSKRLLKSQFNDEPSVSFGICYSGFFDF